MSTRCRTRVSHSLHTLLCDRNFQSNFSWLKDHAVDFLSNQYTGSVIAILGENRVNLTH